MHVLTIGNMYPPSSLGGYEQVWASFVAHLRERGHRAGVLTSDHRAGLARDERDVERRLRLYWRDHEFPRLGLRERVAIERYNARVLADRIARDRPDAVCWWGMGGMSLSLIEQVRRRGIPAAGMVCDDWMVYGPRVDAWTRIFARRPWLAPVAERGVGVPARVDLGRAARWLFLSRMLRDRATGAGEAVAGAGICHRGPDDTLFQPRPAHDWGWRLLYAGRIDPRKGIATAIEALASLPREAKLVIDGDGDARHRDELEALAAREGLADRARFATSARVDLPDAYAAADAVVFPVTWDEPWGLVPLEAMAVGTPVIATGTGGSGEYLEDGANCLLFTPGDPQGLAACVARLAADAGLRERLRAGGLATAARFGETDFNSRIESTLEQAVRDAV